MPAHLTSKTLDQTIRKRVSEVYRQTQKRPSAYASDAMEGMNIRLKNEGKTLENDTGSRLTTRPETLKDRQYLEKPTFGRQKTHVSQGGSRSSSESRGSKFKPVLPEVPRSKNIVSSSSSRSQSSHIRSLIAAKTLEEDENDDDDELDLLSESSQHGSEHDPSSSLKPVNNSRRTNPSVTKHTHISTKTVKSNKSQKQAGRGIDETTGLEYHPQFLPQSVLKSLSFKKNKPQDNKQEYFTPSLSNSTLDVLVSKENKLPGNNGPSSWDLVPEQKGKEKAEILDLTSSPAKGWDDSDAKSPSPLSGKSANSNRPATPSSPSGSYLPLPDRSRYDNNETPKQDSGNARSKMRPRHIPKDRTTLDATENRDRNGRKYTKSIISTTKTVDARSRSESVQIVSPKQKMKGPAKPAPFPVKALDEDLQPRSKPVDKPKKVPGSSTRAPKLFPLFVSGQPGQATDKSNNIKGKGKNKDILNITEDEEEDEGEDSEDERRKKLKPKAFPISKELFSSTNTSRSLGSAGKRLSEASSGDERSSKKSRKGLDK